MFTTSRHRRDIQGLRAVAVVLVALNHAGVPGLPGGYIGVDVFFVLSGYLITGLLLRDGERNGEVSIASFYERRARRILPAAILTLSVTAVAAYKILNVVRAPEALRDIGWSAFFASNFRFIDVGNDYFARGRPQSPVLHFWSLAVEEQFYLAWPLILALLLFGITRRKKHGKRVLTENAVTRARVFIAVALLASLAFAVHQTSSDPTTAYFSPFTRAWELAAGALLATFPVRLGALPQRAGLALSWTGVALIAVATVFFDDGTKFPGVAALVPVLGAVAFIAAGVAPREHPASASRLLGYQPFRYIGDISYTLYLWHWPILILARAENDGEQLPLGTRLALLAGAVVLSSITYRFIENPIHRGRWPKTSEDNQDALSRRPALLFWPLTPIVVLFFTSFGWHDINDKTDVARNAQIVAQLETHDAAVRRQQAAAKLTAQERAAANEEAQAALNAQVSSNTPLPAVTKAAQAAASNAKLPAGLQPSPAAGDLSRYIAPIAPNCSPTGSKTRSDICSLSDGRKKLVVFGDSHTQMWLPTLASGIGAKGYSVRPVMKSACSARYWGGKAGPPPGCLAWLKWAEGQVKKIRPDVVLLAVDYLPSEPGVDPDSAAAARGVTDVATALKKYSKRVILLGDVFGQKDLPDDCLLKDGSNQGTCSTPFDSDRIAENRSIAESVVQLGGGFVDTTSFFCASNTCPTVIGNTVAYADKDHVTTTYAKQVARQLNGKLERAISKLDAR